MQSAFVPAQAWRRQDRPASRMAAEGPGDQCTDGSKLEQPEHSDMQGKSREMKIARRLLGKYGFTDSCLGCLPHQQGLDRREHNIICRNRIYGQMMINVDELGRIRLHEEKMGRMRGKDERVRRMNESDVPQSTSVDAGNGGVVSPNPGGPPPLFGDLKSPLIKKSSMRRWRGMTSKIKGRALEPKFWDRDEEPMERVDISLM